MDYETAIKNLQLIKKQFHKWEFTAAIDLAIECIMYRMIKEKNNEDAQA